jgi:hypoxanthine phosphoribosyltransferase
VSSYGGGTQSTGVVRIIKDVDQNIAGKHVIVVEDIVDSGLTLNHLKQLLSTRKPASIALCTAFDKPERRKVPIEVEYVGRRIPDEFIVGYGLDYDGIYRNLPEVRILREAAEE